jgi:lactate dehydrogenase-like 2-hydroxyacid dehydrogenase
VVEHVDLPVIAKAGIRLGYTPDVLTDAVADLTVMLALMATRNGGEGISLVQSGGVSLPVGLPSSQLIHSRSTAVAELLVVPVRSLWPPAQRHALLSEAHRGLSRLRANRAGDSRPPGSFRHHALRLHI